MKTREFLGWKNGESFSISAENAPCKFTVGSVSLWERLVRDNDFQLIPWFFLEGKAFLGTWEEDLDPRSTETFCGSLLQEEETHFIVSCDHSKKEKGKNAHTYFIVGLFLPCKTVEAVLFEKKKKEKKNSRSCSCEI